MEKLDYILISLELQQFISITKIESCYLSDHNAPYVRLVMDSHLSKGPSRWMLNTLHLEDKYYVEKIREIIRDILEDTTIQGPDAATFKLELIKVMVCRFSIQYGSKKAKSDKMVIAALEKKLNDLQKITS